MILIVLGSFCKALRQQMDQLWSLQLVRTYPLCPQRWMTFLLWVLAPQVLFSRHHLLFHSSINQPSVLRGAKAL